MACAPCGRDGDFDDGQGICFEATTQHRDVQYKLAGAGKGTHELVDYAGSKRGSAGFCETGVSCGNLCCVVCFFATAVISIYIILVFAGLLALPNGTKIQMRFKDSGFMASPVASTLAPQASQQVAHSFIMAPSKLAVTHDFSAGGGKHVSTETVAAQELSFDCNADVDVWERAWSTKKKEYCCRKSMGGGPGCEARTSVSNALTADQLESCNSMCTISGRPRTCRVHILDASTSIFRAESRQDACAKSFNHIASMCDVCNMCPPTVCAANGLAGAHPIHT